MTEKCDSCGKYIAERDFDHGAIKHIIVPYTVSGREAWEILCIRCNKKESEDE